MVVRDCREISWLSTYIFDELMPISFVRMASDHCLRFMHGYRSGLVGPVLEYTVKKYKSHRRLSPHIRLDEIASEFAEKKEKDDL